MMVNNACRGVDWLIGSQPGHCTHFNVIGNIEFYKYHSSDRQSQEQVAWVLLTFGKLDVTRQKFVPHVFQGLDE